MANKLYTKTGDKGTTSLIGGAKVSKSNDRINSYGNVDELNAQIGLLRDQDIKKSIKKQLLEIQENLFRLGSLLASEPDFKGFELPQITIAHVNQLEGWIDEYDKVLPVLKNFILPGGHIAVSICHVCRTVCRRTERGIIKIAENGTVDENILAFVNRLSDYFFILARQISKDLDVPEIPWVPHK
jgi:cob(I)alamin adenosyltransferase